MPLFIINYRSNYMATPKEEEVRTGSIIRVHSEHTPDGAKAGERLIVTGVSEEEIAVGGLYLGCVASAVFSMDADVIAEVCQL